MLLRLLVVDFALSKLVKYSGICKTLTSAVTRLLLPSFTPVLFVYTSHLSVVYFACVLIVHYSRTKIVCHGYELEFLKFLPHVLTLVLSS